jgi:hypothetical protein
MTALASGLPARLTLVLLGIPALAHALAGTAAVTGASRLRPRGCGALRTDLSGTLVVADDGTWSADFAGEEGQVAGTYEAIGKTGRKLRLAFDDPSLAVVIGTVEEGVAIVCESGAVIVTSTRLKAAKLTIDRKLERVTLVVRFRFKGNAGGRTGSATYNVRATGAWSAG